MKTAFALLEALSHEERVCQEKFDVLQAIDHRLRHRNTDAIERRPDTSEIRHEVTTWIAQKLGFETRNLVDVNAQIVGYQIYLT